MLSSRDCRADSQRMSVVTRPCIGGVKEWSSRNHPEPLTSNSVGGIMSVSGGIAEVAFDALKTVFDPLRTFREV